MKNSYPLDEGVGYLPSGGHIPGLEVRGSVSSMIKKILESRGGFYQREPDFWWSGGNSRNYQIPKR